MKLAPLNLFVLFTPVSAVLRKTMPTNYIFKCGAFGGGSLTVRDGNMSFQVRLQSLDNLLDPSSDATLTYHIHTSWTHVDSSSSECRHHDLGGTYDHPKCGITTTRGGTATTPCQEETVADRVCSTKRPRGCRAGNLSGRYGTLQVQPDGTAQKWVVNDHHGLLVEHFGDDNTDTQRSDAWSSIAFRYHAQQAEPILCCKIVES